MHAGCQRAQAVRRGVQVRLVEAAVKRPGWGVPEDVLKLLPGPAFEIEQALDDKGLPCEKPLSEKKRAGEQSDPTVNLPASSVQLPAAVAPELGKACGLSS